jgi:hypothetical protein
MTIHGVRYGLDEREAFTAQVAGLLEYVTSSGLSWRPKQVLIVERDTDRSQRIGACSRTLTKALWQDRPAVARGKQEAAVVG